MVDSRVVRDYPSFQAKMSPFSRGGIRKQKNADFIGWGRVLSALKLALTLM
jgi:hypothetical protein